MTATKSEHTEATHESVGVQDIAAIQALNRIQCPAGRDEFTKWLVASCERQDLPVTITDPTLLAAIATLLR